MPRDTKKKVKRYSIGIVAETFGIHEQTLRLYEREGLLIPSRSEKNTRYYTDEDLERLQFILNLTRDMGVNLAGVQVILNMRRKMDDMQREFNRFLEFLRDRIPPELFDAGRDSTTALVRSRPTHSIRVEHRSERSVTSRPVRRIKIETDDRTSE